MEWSLMCGKIGRYSPSGLGGAINRGIPPAQKVLRYTKIREGRTAEINALLAADDRKRLPNKHPSRGGGAMARYQNSASLIRLIGKGKGVQRIRNLRRDTKYIRKMSKSRSFSRSESNRGSYDRISPGCGLVKNIDRS